MDVFIGIDVGTQGTKAIAYRPSSPTSSGTILARASCSYSLLPSNVDGRAEQDPDVWIAAVRSVLREIVSDLGLIAPPVASSSDATSPRDGKRCVLYGVGVSGQQHGMVLLDSNCRPLRPAKLWCDVEASRESQWIRGEAASSVGQTGRWDHVLPGFTSPKVLWTIKNEPEVWERVRWVVLPHDYVNLVLRGARDQGESSLGRGKREMAPTTDRGDASGSGIFDPISNDYCIELANAIDQSGRYAMSLPKILDSLDICGSLSYQWMKDIGLLASDCRDRGPNPTDVPYVPISAGSGDNMCSALGVGCVEPGTAVLSLGTSGTVFGVSSAPPSSEVAPFADACGKYLPLACVMSCTAVLNSVLDSFFNGDDGGNGNDTNNPKQEKKKRWTHDDATKMASRHPPGCYGVTFLPYLTPGERTPDWPHASGAILGLTASNMSLALRQNPISESSSLGKGDGEDSLLPPVNQMAGLLYRAAMEGITYLLAEAVSTMASACGDGFRPTCLLVVGGGSRNRTWRQMLADVLGVELRFPRESDSAALGAAFQAGAAAHAARGSREGRKKLSVAEYVMEQSVEMEEEIVLPTSDAKALSLYRKGRERYRHNATRLFGN